MKFFAKLLILFFVMYSCASDDTITPVIPPTESSFECNTPFYPKMPSPDSSENNYDYYTYVWQTEEGMQKLCVNSYAGVSEQSKNIINEVLIADRADWGNWCLLTLRPITMASLT